MSFSVNYNGNGSTSGSAPTDSNAYNNGDTVTVAGNSGSLAKTGTTFGYWTTAADGTGSLYNPGDTFTISANTTLFAQWLITTGLTKDSSGNEGATKNFKFLYHPGLQKTAANPGGPEPARTNAVIAACEGDLATMKGWFGGGVNVTGLTVHVTMQSNGAQWSGGGSGARIQLKAQGAGYSNNAAYPRYLLVSEITEIFMATQNTGWFQSGNEGSKGEGLSRFLGGQFLAANGFLGLGIDADYAVADLWLNSTRDDYVNNAPDDFGYDNVNGCTTLFIYYLFHQLGFSINQIVGAGGATLADVYRNLTGDSGDPFPFFKRLLDTAFPSTTASAVPGPNFDDPWPIALLSFGGVKDTYGSDEVNDLLSTSGGVYPNGFYLFLEGLNRQVVGSTTPTNPVVAFAGTTTSLDPSGIAYESDSALIPQKVRYPYDVDFTNAALGAFPASGETPAAVTTSITLLGKTFPANTEFFFTAGADPYFANVQPNADPKKVNEPWLSQDLRVFTATPGESQFPVPGGPKFDDDSFDGAYTYIGKLITHLNDNFGDPTLQDPFDPNSNVIPGQEGAYTGDSSVTPKKNGHNNYNFAIARVRLKGAVATAHPADDVKVFFRLWGTQTADTDWQPGYTYLSDDATGQNPQYPLAPPDNHTIPFFATGNTPNLTDPNNPEYGANGFNNRKITIKQGDGQWAYFGCFLNLYDKDFKVNGTAVRDDFPGDHHCIVAQIAYAGTPIRNVNGVVMTTENSDKLAQRNLQVTASDNPGPPATHRVPQTFDIRPTALAPAGSQSYPDELMIDWGRTPPGSVATIYWPQVNATDVVELASKIYSTHLLSVADPHTIRCHTTRGVTYVPIPFGSGDSFAGLFTVDLPPTVVQGQEFNVVVRRLGTRRIRVTPPPPPPPPGPRIDNVQVKRETVVLAREGKSKTERYVVGSFQVKIPVRTGETILRPEETKLAIFKARLAAMSPSNRWYPVLRRYLKLIAGRIDGLGGDAAAIPPSFDGLPHHGGGHGIHGANGREIDYTGKVKEVTYDCSGDFIGFVLASCTNEHRFESREPHVGRLVREAFEDRLRLTIIVRRHDHKILRLIVH